MLDEYPYLALLCQLEDYIPFMLEDEIIYIIFVGLLPSPECVARWDIQKARRESEIGEIFALADARQREKLAKNSQIGF